ncbi:MAG: hypothetical protein IKX15_01955 [Spirochaetales bacterium]|nr:hypothetical protein [Spirochaetales bacterium]
MNKKLISVILLALVVLSFAGAARIINLAIGPSFSYFKGVAPLSDDDPDTNTPYEGKAFGFDATLSFTFGSHAEIFFEDVFNFSAKTAFEELGNDNLLATMNYKSYFGYEHALITGPLKLSIGFAGVIDVVASLYQFTVGDETYQVMPMVLNIGFGATAKAEFELLDHLSFYVKANADYLPFSVFLLSTQPSDDDPPSWSNTTKNINFGASAGLVLFF